MRITPRLALPGSIIALCLLFPPDVHAAWWERPAATWYYKDDWKAQALVGGRGYRRTFRLDEPCRSGWIVVWGDRGYRLTVGSKLVGQSVDGGLIDDFDLGPFVAGAKELTIVLEGSRVCAEGELVTQGGKRVRLDTGDGWENRDGRPVRTEAMRSGPSAGAFDRAHNGRLLYYNDEERGKSTIAKTLARLQRLDEQLVFLLRRLRPAEEILSFEPQVLWRRAEGRAGPLAEKARKVIADRAIPAQKVAQFQQSQAAAGEAALLVEEAELAVTTATAIYRAERQILHLENCAEILGQAKEFEGALKEARKAAEEARRQHAQPDFAAVARIVKQCSDRAAEVRKRLESTKDVVSLGGLDEFPESPFGWLNARQLMGNDPAGWPLTIAPSDAGYLDLSGQWDFRTDPDNQGLEKGWHTADKPEPGWRAIPVPQAWERAGFTQDNLKSPADCPYQLKDRRTGDKPYNGFAWYRKQLLVPKVWQERRVILALGKVRNWAEVYVNGQRLSEGRLDPPAEQEIDAKLLRFGQPNLIAIRVYNHDQWGGIQSGPVALFVAGSKRAERETPGPLSFVKEYTYSTPAGPVRQTLLASALSPGVVVATEGPVLELWGWEARGHRPPTSVQFASANGVKTGNLDEAGPIAKGEELAEDRILLRAEDRDVLVVLDGRPASIRWGRNRAGLPCLTIGYERGPVRAALLVSDPGVRTFEQYRFLARALHRYPVGASEVVTRANSSDPLFRDHNLRYRYLALDGFGPEPLTMAPLPMLASIAAAARNPHVLLWEAPYGCYSAPFGPYLVGREGTDRARYQARAVDRSKVRKGIGELFHNKPPEVFRQMADWGCDHVRYAWAFHANWDIPLVKHVGGPPIEDNEDAWRKLDEAVDRCNAAGMQMMLTWFFNEDAPQRDAGGAVRNSTRYWRLRPETKKNVFELWRRIAQRYADRPDWAISYDFFNEPAYMNPDHWNEIVRELTAVIRSVDKRHMLVWESADGWAQPDWCLWLEPNGDPNTLYSFHRYGKHWGYAYDEYYPGYKNSPEQSQIEPWLEAILFGIKHNVPIHCGEFGVSMLQPEDNNLAWLDDYLALFERFGIGWNWWNYSGSDVYRTGLVAGDRESPHVAILKKWFGRSGWGASRKARK